MLKFSNGFKKAICIIIGLPFGIVAAINMFILIAMYYEKYFGGGTDPDIAGLFVYVGATIPLAITIACISKYREFSKVL